ncbi:transcription antiterminator [Enterococcus saccharolyticus]|uniref:BglG family transcription antiterminator n=1 Tax=Enterococcus TaxID=1350 RepID=UPI00137B3B29|nr:MULTISPECIES: BglG family transcription antiterminator [Enterococcus]MCD5000932.1 transcription antiterminator [Enterococcus saccharolyticus]
MNPLERQQEIIQLLQHTTNHTLTANELAAHLMVSSKTIRNDISQLNKQGDEPIIQSKAGQGFMLIRPSEVSVLPIKEDVRFRLVYHMIEKQAINFFELADLLFVSESTLDRLVRELNAVIEKQDKKLLITRQQNQLFIPGDEEQKRKLFNIFLNREIEINKLSLDKYSNYFTSCDLGELSDCIIHFHREKNIVLNDFSTISFVLHLAVLIERVAMGSILSEEIEAYDKDMSYQIAQELSTELKKIRITIPENELPYIRRLYLGKLPKQPQIEDYYLTEIVEQILESIRHMYKIDFSKDEQFKTYLTMHLSGLYTRGIQKSYLTNPLVEEMKNKFPFIYNISVYAASMIQKQLVISFPDDEIAYIALHFLSASETLRINKKKRVLVVSPYGIASQRIISQKLSKITGFSIEIIQFLSVLEYKASKIKNVDLIVTSEYLEPESDVPIYHYASFLTDHDILEITKLFEQQAKKSTVFERFFKKELFFSQMSFDTREAVIDFLCQQLLDKGYCNEEYHEKVLERELLSSTSYGNYFAIPHAIKRCAEKNAVSICCLDKAIDWGGKKVKLVLLLALKEEREDMFEELFVQLVEMLNEPSFVKKLAKQQTFEAFIYLCQHSMRLNYLQTNN